MGLCGEERTDSMKWKREVRLRDWLIDYLEEIGRSLSMLILILNFSSMTLTISDWKTVTMRALPKYWAGFRGCARVGSVGFEAFEAGRLIMTVFYRIIDRFLFALRRISGFGVLAPPEMHASWTKMESDLLDKYRDFDAKFSSAIDFRLFNSEVEDVGEWFNVLLTDGVDALLGFDYGVLMLDWVF